MLHICAIKRALSFQCSLQMHNMVWKGVRKQAWQWQCICHGRYRQQQAGSCIGTAVCVS